MMFGLAHFSIRRIAALAAALSALVLFATGSFAGELGTAVIPKTIIYPGQEIDSGQLQVVEVTNPNLMGGYARTIPEVVGYVTTKTLLPGRTILISALRQQYTVRRGAKITLVYDNGTLRITAAGTPLSDAVVGDLIQVRNTDTGVIIHGTVMDDGSILVAQK